MKNLAKYINEKLVISKKLKQYQYSCQPKDKYELRDILRDRLAQDKNANLNDIDVSQIADMHELFYNLDPYNIDISEWDVSNVKDMSNMFDMCTNFNSNLTNWDVSNVDSMQFMFYRCDKFEGKGLENWNVSNVVDMREMFNGCKCLNCDLSNWDVSNVKDISWMFNRCEKFEGKGLENWDVSNVAFMQGAFHGCKNLNSNLSGWDVSKVKDIYRQKMLAGCTSLKNIPSWYKE